jgi:hypothetical protein
LRPFAGDRWGWARSRRSRSAGLALASGVAAVGDRLLLFHLEVLGAGGDDGRRDLVGDVALAAELSLGVVVDSAALEQVGDRLPGRVVVGERGGEDGVEPEVLADADEDEALADLGDAEPLGVEDAGLDAVAEGAEVGEDRRK